MRFFADQCIPNTVLDTLRGSGHQVLPLREHIPTNSDDEEVISEAQRQGAILISLDGDFSDIVRYPPASYGGIISLQLRNHPELMPRLMTKLNEHLAAHLDSLYYKGELILVEAHRIRVRQ